MSSWLPSRTSSTVLNLLSSIPALPRAPKPCMCAYLRTAVQGGCLQSCQPTCALLSSYDNIHLRVTTVPLTILGKEQKAVHLPDCSPPVTSPRLSCGVVPASNLSVKGGCP
jgi:hypothetical protein